MPENTPDQKPTRKLPRTAFKKGQSGNPGGRPKQIRDVVAAAREHTELAIRRLADWAASDHPTASVAASNALLNRGYGMPAQKIEDGREDPALMSDADLNAWLAAEQARRGDGEVRH